MKTASTAAIAITLCALAQSAAAFDLDVAGINVSIYGNLHMSADLFEDRSATLSSNTSAVGIRGSKKLDEDSGLTAIFQIEFQVDPTERNTDRALVDRDQWLGLKGNFGSVHFGTISSNYKQMGSKVDPLWRTPLESRGFLNIASPRLHAGAGETRGRLTNTVQYRSKTTGGFSFVANTTLDGRSKESYGAGARYKINNVSLYADAFSSDESPVTGVDETAFKVGGWYQGDKVFFGLQYEAAEDLTGADYIFASGRVKISPKNSIILVVGQADGVTNAQSNTSWGLAFNHQLHKSTNTYIGYGDKDSDDDVEDDSLITVGLRFRF